jgi:hypothetical protein
LPAQHSRKPENQNRPRNDTEQRPPTLPDPVEKINPREIKGNPQRHRLNFSHLHKSATIDVCYT